MLHMCEAHNGERLLLPKRSICQRSLVICETPGAHWVYNAHVWKTLFLRKPHLRRCVEPAAANGLSM